MLCCYYRQPELVPHWIEESSPKTFILKRSLENYVSQKNVSDGRTKGYVNGLHNETRSTRTTVAQLSKSHKIQNPQPIPGIFTQATIRNGFIIKL